MPKYSFVCGCGNRRDLIRPAGRQNGPFNCDKCGELMTRDPSPATSRMVEILDNGLMTRRVERPANAEKLYKDRAQQMEADKHKL